MKKIVGLTLILCAMLFTTNVNAQSPLHLGVKAGVNFADFGGDVAGTSMKTGFVVGATLDIDLPSSFYIQTGLDFTMKGSKVKILGQELMKANPMYLQVPIHAGYKLDLGKVKLNFSAGPYVAVGIAGKLEALTVDEWDWDLGKEKVDFFGSDAAKRFDAGIGFKVGAELGRFGLNFGYDWGLANMAGDGYSLKNKNLFLTLGYRIF